MDAQSNDPDSGQRGVAGVALVRRLMPRFLRRAKNAAPSLPGTDDGKLAHGTATSAAVRQMDLRGLRVVLAAAALQADRSLMLQHEGGDDTGAFVISPHAADASAVRGTLQAAHQGRRGLQERAAEILRLWQGAYGPADVLVGCWHAPTCTLAYFSVGFETPSIIHHGWPHRSQAPIETGGPAGQEMTFGVHQLTSNERWLLFTRPLVNAGDPQRQPFNEVGLVQYADDAVAMEPAVWVRYLLQQALRAHRGTLPSGALLVSLMCSNAVQPAQRTLERIAGGARSDE